MQGTRFDPPEDRIELQILVEDESSRLDVFPSESDSPFPATTAPIAAPLVPRPAAVTAVSAPSQQARLPAAPPPQAPAATRESGLRLGVALLAVALVVALSGVVWLAAPGLVSRSGALQIETDTPGADVVVDGTYRGKTPLLLPLAAGEHRLEVRQGELSRSVPVEVAERATVVHHISWAPAAEPVQATGGLEITSEPRGQFVMVDGQPSGVTPLTVTGLAPGAHEVAIRRNGTMVRRMVQVESGATASLMITAGGAGPTSGWLTVDVPVPVQVYEAGALVGSSESERILVPAGQHVYDFVNTALGFQASETVQVGAGQTAAVALSLPRGTINVNAIPWAEVWLDGQALGETPIGNVTWTIGPHEVILRHPEFGERRITATITTGDPARVAVDMRKPQ